MALVEQFGIERLGFLTLTFADHVTAIKEASRRFNNLNRRVLKGRYKRIVAVPERQKSGRLHFHCLVVLDADIRTGLDFAAVARRDYRTASAALKSEWSFWLETAPRYGFGRTELLPIKSTAEGISKYVGKYIAKHIDARIEADKGARLVRYLGYRRGERSFHPHMMFNSPHAWLWRKKVKEFARQYGIVDIEHFKKMCGRRWFYILKTRFFTQFCLLARSSRRWHSPSKIRRVSLRGGVCWTGFGLGRIPENRESAPSKPTAQRAW